MVVNRKGHSIIFWGPPGVGKTTLAQIIAHSLDMPFFTLSAIDSGVKDVRAVIEEARKAGHALLFIDEIHRFNKAQQDSLLGAVEKGIITLIGATTENPSFEVISALLSRCQVYVLKPLTEDHLMALVNQAIQKDKWLAGQHLNIKEWEALMQLSGGDARGCSTSWSSSPLHFRMTTKLLPTTSCRILYRRRWRYMISQVSSTMISSPPSSSRCAAVTLMQPYTGWHAW